MSKSTVVMGHCIKDSLLSHKVPGAGASIHVAGPEAPARVKLVFHADFHVCGPGDTRPHEILAYFTLTVIPRCLFGTPGHELPSVFHANVHVAGPETPARVK